MLRIKELWFSHEIMEFRRLTLVYEQFKRDIFIIFKYHINQKLHLTFQF